MRHRSRRAQERRSTAQRRGTVAVSHLSHRRLRLNKYAELAANRYPRAGTGSWAGGGREGLSVSARLLSTRTQAESRSGA